MLRSFSTNFYFKFWNFFLWSPPHKWPSRFEAQPREKPTAPHTRRNAPPRRLHSRAQRTGLFKENTVTTTKARPNFCFRTLLQFVCLYILGAFSKDGISESEISIKFCVFFSVPTTILNFAKTKIWPSPNRGDCTSFQNFSNIED